METLAKEIILIACGSFLALLLAFLIVIMIFEQIRQKEFIENATLEQKAILMEYEAIKKNPFKKVKNNGKNVQQ